MIKRSLLICIATLLLAGCSRYDPTKPDTPANKKGFKAILRVDPNQNVKDIYFFADEHGIDPVYCIAFQTSSEVVQKIIANFNLQERENASWKEPFNRLPTEFAWWNAEERSKSKYYFSRKESPENEYRLWFDPMTGKCQFLMVCF